MNQSSRGSAGRHLIQPRGAAGEGFPVRENTTSSCQPCPETASWLRGGSAPPRPPARVARTEALRGYSTQTPGFQVYSQCPASSNRILNFPAGSGGCPAPSTPLPGRPGRAFRGWGNGRSSGRPYPRALRRAHKSRSKSRGSPNSRWQREVASLRIPRPWGLSSGQQRPARARHCEYEL